MPKWAQFEQVLNMLAGPIMTIAGVPPQFIPLAVHGMATAEGMVLPGADKKASVISLITDAAAGTATALNKPDLTVVVGNGIDLTIKAVNLFKPVMETTK